MAPPENARLGDKFLWHTANLATEAVPWALGGIPGIGAKVATRAAVSGVGKLAKRSFGAVPTTVETVGITYDELLDQGYPKEEARNMASGIGAATAFAGAFTPQFHVGTGQNWGERVLTEGANQVFQGGTEDGTEWAMRRTLGLDY